MKLCLAPDANTVSLCLQSGLEKYLRAYELVRGLTSAGGDVEQLRHRLRHEMRARQRDRMYSGRLLPSLELRTHCSIQAGLLQ